jgi:DNA-binding NtrC family response regulator
MEAARERILVVDDEENVQTLFKWILGKEGYEVECASNGEEALGRLETQWFDMVISDLKMPGMDGFEFVKRAKRSNPSIPCVLLTAFGTIESAVAAIKEGAYDYLTKPANTEQIKLVVKRGLELHRLTREVDRLRAQVENGSDFGSIVGHSKAMRPLFHLIKLVAKSNSTILIQGESGTGKELIARAIHQNSLRRDQTFVAIDCGALPETLLESELFGHVRGAFTGAINNKKGLFEEAHGGTLLLDEIGDTTPTFQSKLSRVLQENEIRPLGTTKSIKIDVRVIAATNKDLKKEVERGNFREDLFYRLAVVPIVIPPLRSRKEDIPLLVNHFINKYSQQNELEPKTITPNALRLLLDHSWPGNVRELEHLIERAVLISPGPEINLEVLSPAPVAADESPTPLHQATKGAREIVERRKIAEALQKAGGNRSHAARLLGISRSALYNKLKSYDLVH